MQTIRGQGTGVEPRLFQTPGLLFSVFIGSTNTSVKKVDGFFTRVIIRDEKKKKKKIKIG